VYAVIASSSEAIQVLSYRDAPRGADPEFIAPQNVRRNGFRVRSIHSRPGMTAKVILDCFAGARNDGAAAGKPDPMSCFHHDAARIVATRLHWIRP
jgi:hypothetical protein